MSSINHYNIGWICAIDTEIIAAEMMFDELLGRPADIASNDVDSYSFGRITEHHIVVACLPHSQYGISNATAAVKDMLHSFPIKTVVMVGIAGGAPSIANGIDIRLGDVVVSSPGIQNGGVLQYGFGKKHQDENDPFRIENAGHLNQPPLSMLNAVNQLKASHHKLYLSNVIHEEHQISCDACGDDPSTLVDRTARDPDDDDPIIHHVLIGSSDYLMRDAVMRDKLSQQWNILCFEMEAAGLMNHVPCIVIRGICDYSDTHKNRTWQGYAAMTAAAYAKELLSKIRPDQMSAEETLISKLAGAFSKFNNQLTNIRDDMQWGTIQDWLSPADPFTNFNNAQAQHCRDTGRWFLHSNTYDAWKHDQNSFMWLNGISGCGKTILSSCVIADLKRTTTSYQNLLYFFFDFNDAKKQSPGEAVRSFISQLYFQRQGIRGQIESLKSSCQEGCHQPDDPSLYNLFHEILCHYGETYIVIDALD